MKAIYEYEFNPNMGVLIDVRNPVDYEKSHNPLSINIFYDKLLLNHHSLLDKKKKYFLICDKGNKSKKAARILNYYGYDVTYVINT